jgi:hypothetical protein
VRDYGLYKVANLEEGISDDKLDVVANLAVDEYFGA